ncbi:MAG: GNAT family N-acetyltransferase [Actinomycetales bacterium]|nr:GNAT family N-acetyltransferase [Actinomycetales bacterium]
MTVRPAVPEDDLDTIHAADPTWVGSEWFWAFAEALLLDHPAFTWCYDDGGVAVGHAALDCQARRSPTQAAAYLWVAPSARRRGAGTALGRRVLDVAREHGFSTVLVPVPEADPDGRSVTEHWGGRVDGHHFEQTLDLGGLTDPRVSDLTARAIGSGVTFHEVSGDDGMRAVYPFVRDRYDEAPDTGEASEPLTLEVLQAMATPENMLVACVGDRTVGVTCVTHRTDDPPTVNTVFTGVHPESRGLGIATALKAEQARRLRDRGYRTLVTQNMEGNEPILAANVRMGFRRGPGWFDYIVPTRP